MTAALAVLPTTGGRAPAGRKVRPTTTDTVTDQGRHTAAFSAEPFRHRIHSREEDQGDVRFYRTGGFPVPPSHGGDGLEMQPVGSFVFRRPVLTPVQR